MKQPQQLHSVRKTEIRKRFCLAPPPVPAWRSGLWVDRGTADAFSRSVNFLLVSYAPSLLSALASASISFSHYNLIRYLSAAISGRDVVETMPVTLQVCARAPVKEE